MTQFKVMEDKLASLEKAEMAKQELITQNQKLSEIN